jgi:sulfatase maturation enzyme AslB (radical SAM superfamily)
MMPSVITFSNNKSRDIPLNNVRMLIIYLGNECNFDCVYCDRGYIKSLGGQSLNTTHNLQDFFLWAEKQDNEVEWISFHGGEPLLFAKRMEQILEWLMPIAERNSWKVGMTTNGSLVKQNEHLFEKYSGKLGATISYDFMYQEQNRDALDVEEMAGVLNKHCFDWKWQYVLPIEDKKAFSFDNIKSVVSTCYKTGCKTINIIPLRHHRGKDKFDVIIDRVNLQQFFSAFLEFIQILYIKKLNVFIDGNYDKIDKAYFGEHNKLILSPDGYLYPEFDFLEYKIKNTRIGKWSNVPEVWEPLGDKDRIFESCEKCLSRPSCGLKYLYKLFDKQPGTSCKEFYQFVDVAIKHNSKLKNNKSLFELVGIDTTFYINT